MCNYICKMNGNPRIKKEKLGKLIRKNESEDKDIEHELSYYMNDRVKLMKEVLKIIKPKKIRSMAPSCIKKLDNEEINSMLLEELLGISNKRLKYIFNGQNLEEDSSTDEEEHLDDVISLDEISDDDFIIDLDSDKETTSKRCKKHRSKMRVVPKKIKKEKLDSISKSNQNKSEADEGNEQNLMSVLELLELQARARAIRSQLALENQKKIEERQKSQESVENIASDDDEVIVESPKNEEIVITSSDSENEDEGRSNKNATESMDIEKQSSVEAVVVKDTAENIQDKDIEVDRNGDIEKDNDGAIEIDKDGDIQINKDEDTEIDKDDGVRNKMNQIVVHHIDIIQKSSNVDETSGNPREENDIDESSYNDEKRKHRKCKRKQVKKKTHNAEESSETCHKIEEKTNHDDTDGIVLNVEQSDMDCINLE